MRFKTQKNKKSKFNHVFKILSLLFLVTQTNLLLAGPIKKGDIVFVSNFNSPSNRSEWSKLNSAQWVQQGMDNDTCLYINGTGMIHTNIHLSAYKGMKLKFRCMAKAENVTMPLETYLGVKFMFHYKTASEEVWQNQNNVYGTFDWRDLSFVINIPTDVTDGDLNLGLQGSSGKVWFDRILVTVEKEQFAPVKKNNHLIVSTKYRGAMSPFAFKQKDIQVLGKEWGANLIRWQLNVNIQPSKDGGSYITKYNTLLNEKLNELDSVLIVCKQVGIKVVIDLHSLPGGRDSLGSRIFYDKIYNDYFITVWQKIAKRYKGNPTVWGYDLMNEPIQNKPPSEGMDFMQTQMKVSKTIRRIDKKTAIIFEVEAWDAPSSYLYLSPVPFSNVIYEVHMYQPESYTHQGVFDNKSGITYPGLIGNSLYDKNALRKILQPVRDFQLSYNASIYVGEFSAIRWAPGAAQYLSDCIDIFEEYGWNWTYHAFREYNGWDVEYENGTSKNDPPKRATKDTDRKKLLLNAFAKNKKP
jgi:aryl-phospho-beta-D-glucosidase BglC (GH1 family)